MPIATIEDLITQVNTLGTNTTALLTAVGNVRVGLTASVDGAAASAAAALANKDIAVAKAGTATTDAASALASKDSALASYNSFRSSYYGPLAADPALDPLGAACTEGDLYLNTVLGRMQVFRSNAWIDYEATTIAAKDAAVAAAATATTKAAAALASEAAALVSKNAAAASQTALAAALASFRELYLGTFAVDPTLDGNGQALKEGAEYFNSVSDKLRTYVNGAWEFYDATAQAAINNANLSAVAAAASAATFTVNFTQMAASLINTQAVVASHHAFA